MLKKNRNNLCKPLEGFHLVFNVDVCQGNAYCNSPDVGVAKNLAKCLDVFGLVIVLGYVGMA